MSRALRCHGRRPKTLSKKTTIDSNTVIDITKRAVLYYSNLCVAQQYVCVCADIDFPCGSFGCSHVAMRAEV